MGHRIVVVDAEPVIRKTLASILERDGYEVIKASDPAVVVETIKSEPPALIITTVSLPGGYTRGQSPLVVAGIRPVLHPCNNAGITLAWTRRARYPRVGKKKQREPAMTIEIRKPELEQLVQEEFLSGRFESVDDLLTEALHALREKNAHLSPTQAEAIEKAKSKSDDASARPRKNLAQFLMESPFAGSDLNLERHQDTGGHLNRERVSS